MDLTRLSIARAAEMLRDGLTTALALAEAHLENIKTDDPRLNAYITVTETQARQQAENADAVLKRYRQHGGNPPGLLCGIPIALKDLYETEGIRTTAGSVFFKDYIPEKNAGVVERLYRAGAVLMGKLNMHEIALGVTSVNPHFGACHNPRDTDRMTGGSSGGSAAALVAGLCMGSLGSDTGGSIRIPASLCGCVGLKPTYGRVSLNGVMPLSWHLDHAGPMARNVEDAAILLQAIAGHDQEDPYSVNRPVEDYLARIKDGVKGWEIAIAGDNFFMEKTDNEVMARVTDAARVFGASGAVMTSVDFSMARDAFDANGAMVVADAAALHEKRLKAHPEKFGDDVRQRLETGASFSATRYVGLRRTQALLRQRFIRFFKDYDLLLTPTTAVTAPFIEGPDAVAQAALLTRFTGPFNLTGLPAISIPCGHTRKGLPVGLQIIGPPWSEARILRAAYAFEAASHMKNL